MILKSNLVFNAAVATMTIATITTIEINITVSSKPMSSVSRSNFCLTLNVIRYYSTDKRYKEPRDYSSLMVENCDNQENPAITSVASMHSLSSIAFIPLDDFVSSSLARSKSFRTSNSSHPPT